MLVVFIYMPISQTAGLDVGVYVGFSKGQQGLHVMVVHTSDDTIV